MQQDKLSSNLHDAAMHDLRTKRLGFGMQAVNGNDLEPLKKRWNLELPLACFVTASFTTFVVCPLLHRGLFAVYNWITGGNVIP